MSGEGVRERKTGKTQGKDVGPSAVLVVDDEGKKEGREGGRKQARRRKKDKGMDETRNLKEGRKEGSWSLY